MLKPGSLRAAIAAAVPLFVADPDRLKVWVDDGRIVARRTKALGFEYRYQLQVYAEAVTIGPDELLVPILFWLRKNQPDLLLRFQDDAAAIRFAADILDANSWNIAVTLDLSEAMSVTPKADGTGFDVAALPEPSPDDPPLDGALVDQPLVALSANDMPLA